MAVKFKVVTLAHAIVAGSDWTESEASVAGRDGVAAICEAGEGVGAGSVGSRGRAGRTTQGHGRAAPPCRWADGPGDREGGSGCAVAVKFKVVTLAEAIVRSDAGLKVKPVLLGVTV